MLLVYGTRHGRHGVAEPTIGQKDGRLFFFLPIGATTRVNTILCIMFLYYSSRVLASMHSIFCKIITYVLLIRTTMYDVISSI